jgi:uncharacterized protein involved in exopolysaccharide biosynthesis
MMSSSGDSPEQGSSGAERYVPVRIETAFVEEEAEPASLLRLVNVVLRHRRLVVGVPIVLAAVVCTVLLVLPRTYTVAVSFVPSEAEGQLSQLAGLAAQFGFSLPGSDAAESPEFYASLLRSGAVLRSAVGSSYRIVDETDPDTTWIAGDLIQLLEIRGRTRPRQVESAVKELQQRLTTRTSPETGMIALSVSTRWPELSVQITERLLELVNEFNLETRQSRASNERQFVTSRLEQAGAELREAEDSLQSFLQQNRRIENSPQLRFERDRLQRRVSLQQQVTTSLAQALEQAKIEEVRNTPVITVVEAPFQPARPDRRRLIVKGLLTLVLGGFLGVVLAFANEFFLVSKQRDPDRYTEFRSLSADAKRDVQRLWRRLRGRGDSHPPDREEMGRGY